MVFWLICLMLALIVVAIVVAPLLRAAEPVDAAPELAIYKDQLAEIERELAGGVIDAAEARRAKAEIARRLLDADKVVRNTVETAGTSRGAALAAAAVILAVSGGMYWRLGAPGYPDLPLSERLANSDAARENRPTQAQAEAAAPERPVVEVPAEYLATIDQLRLMVPTRPDDLQGWELLAFHESQLSNYAAAAKAQVEVVRVKADAVAVDDLRLLLDLLVTAADGFISPQAEAVARDILERDESHVPARYYIGALYNQTDRPDIAFRIWRPIAEDGDALAYHVQLARAQIADAAFRAGADYNLPDVRGPNADDIANAAEMSAEDRAAMVGNMVAGLADRLATQGGPVADWARLIAAYGVMGDGENARAIWVEASDVFGANAQAMQVLTDAAQSAGVLE